MSSREDMTIEDEYQLHLALDEPGNTEMFVGALAADPETVLPYWSDEQLRSLGAEALGRNARYKKEAQAALTEAEKWQKVMNASVNIRVARHRNAEAAGELWDRRMAELEEEAKIDDISLMKKGKKSIQEIGGE